MSTPTEPPAFQSHLSPPATGRPSSMSLTAGDHLRNAPLDQVAFFDHVAAYEALHEAKKATRQLYSDKNIERSDALEVQDATKERLDKSREKPKRYRRVRLGGEHWDAPDSQAEVDAWLSQSVDVEKSKFEEMAGDARIFDEEDGQGTFWVSVGVCGRRRLS